MIAQAYHGDIEHSTASLKQIAQKKIWLHLKDYETNRDGAYIKNTNPRLKHPMFNNVGSQLAKSQTVRMTAANTKTFS